MRAAEGLGLGDLKRCACGCGATVKEMDDRKRQRGYVRGHYLRAVARVLADRRPDMSDEELAQFARRVLSL